MDKKIKNLRHGRRVAFIASFANLVLAVMKGAVGYFFGSPILLADAFHSGADLLAHAASGFGLWIAARGKTAKFPYGLYRAETLACLIVGALIIVAGIEIFREGWRKLFFLVPPGSFPILPVAASVVSSIVVFFVSRAELKVGKAIGSQSLVANSREAFLDIFTSLAVLAGILLAYLRIPYVEGAVIILISALLFKLGIENIWTSLLILMDANLDPGLQAEIEKKVNQIYGVKGVGNVKIRKSGPFKIIDCVIATRPSLSLYKAHELSHKVERFIAKNYEHIESVFIHMEPVRTKTVRAAIPVRNMDGLASVVHSHFARAPYFLVLRLSGDHQEIEEFHPNQYVNEPRHAGVKTARMIVRHKIDFLFAFSIGEISFHMLKDSLVNVYGVEEGLSAEEIIRRHRMGRLPLLTVPTRSVENAPGAP
ncbi:Cation transporter [Candidatus Desulfarcum epimagneticum]|uniref:Cation transporter n=1 Tax=uncultured Desulfobacteraceae bacterium TaxID=218296 RepID=A0A484HIP2_9BACT|nr:Cation transporter [uncultured Desulfobacteraceae bacterium]